MYKIIYFDFQHADVYELVLKCTLYSCEHIVHVCMSLNCESGVNIKYSDVVCAILLLQF